MPVKKDEDIFDIALTIYERKSAARYPDLADLTAPLALHTEELLELAGAEANARAEAIRRYRVKSEPFELFNATAYFLQTVLLPAEDNYRVLGLRPGATLEQIEHHHRLISQAFFKTEFDLTSNWKPEQLRRFNAAYELLVEEARRKQERPQRKAASSSGAKVAAGDATVLLGQRSSASVADDARLSAPTETDAPVYASAAKAGPPAIEKFSPVETIILNPSASPAPSPVSTPAPAPVAAPALDENREVGGLTPEMTYIIESVKQAHAASLNKSQIKAAEQSAPAGEEKTRIATKPTADDGPNSPAALDTGATMVRRFTPRWFLSTDHVGMTQREYDIKETTVLGRNRQCDIVIASPEVSRRHAQLQIIQGKLMLTDMQSTNGTFVNDERVTQREVLKGDVIKIDVVEFRVGLQSLSPAVTTAQTDEERTRLYSTPAAALPKAVANRLQGLSEPVSGVTFDLVKDRISIGRSAKNDIVIKDSTVSSVHAELIKQADGWHVHDMNSLNGVYINGQRQQECQIKANDNLRFGRVMLELIAP